MARLIIRNPEGTREVALEASNSVGRLSANKIHLPDLLVSKNHCLIFMDENGAFKIRDSHSRNGTFVNRQRVQEEVVLENGDEITLGMTSCLFLQDRIERGVAVEDDRCQIIVLDKVLPSISRQSRFLPEKEIPGEKELRADYEKLRVAVELQRDIGLELNLHRIFNRILARTFEFLECDQAVILMANADGDMVVEAFKTRAKKEHLIVSSTVVKTVREEKVGIISADALADERFQDALSIVSAKVRSSMAVPILSDEELLGIMVIESSAAVMAYSEKDLLVFTNIAHQTANLVKMSQMAKKIEEDAVTRERFQRLLSPNLAEMVVSGKLKVEKGGETRIATVLFADIRGFTSMCEDIEAPQILNMLNEFFERMVEIAFAYEGTVDKFVGDMIMVVWGAPVTHSDDPVRAVRAALDMQAAVEKCSAASGREIRIGIGINTDELVAGYIGSTRTMSYSVIGDAVNIAARLCSAADAGQILISEQTHRHVHGKFNTAALPPLRAKGKSRPLPVFNVLSRRQAQPPPTQSQTRSGPF